MNQFTRMGAAVAAFLVSVCTVAEPAGQLTAASCASLTGRVIPAQKFSLPTSGARVAETAWEIEADTQGAYCRVMGSIMPVDSNAPPINWQANLPASWNGKLLQYGGGGFNGRIPRLDRQPTLGLDNLPTPVARGYVVFGGDSGHQASSGSDASFARNAEALANYGYMHIKKTHDAVADVVMAGYGEAIQRVYFVGGSTGGREGLTAGLRWPDTYDGILSNYPSAKFMGLRLWGAGLTQAIYRDDSAGWIPPALVDRITQRAIASCDGLDGAEDGLVSNVFACRAQADALIEEFRCPTGRTSADCLNDTQIERSIAIYHDGYELPYELANGFQRYHGYNSLEGVQMSIGTQREYATPPKSGPHAHHTDRAYQFFTNFVMVGSEQDFATFDIMNPGKYQDRLVELSQMIDATNPDWSRFADNGGKLILIHGMEDQSISPLGVVELYKDIQGTLGAAKTHDFMRFYLLPGLAHGGGNMAPAWDNLTALERWVEQGIAPTAQVLTDETNSPTRGRTRPLCEYPAWPKYQGEGDLSNAASFACVVQ